MIWVSLYSSLQKGVEITTIHLPAPPIARLCPGVRCPPPLSLPFRRFHCSLTDNNRWIRERSHESYAKNYSVVFPHDEPLAGRNMRKDPLHQVGTRVHPCSHPSALHCSPTAQCRDAGVG